MAPTLITGDNSMRVAREEIFGPVITLIPFDDEDEAIAIANDTDFGLYDYVFNADGARALKVAKQLQAGHVGINTAQRNHEAPSAASRCAASAATAATRGSSPTPSLRRSSSGACRALSPWTWRRRSTPG